MPRSLLLKVNTLILLLLILLSCSATTITNSQIASPEPTKPISSSTESSQPISSPATEPTISQEAAPTATYLPLIRNGNAKFIGFIDDIYWTENSVPNHMQGIDALAGQQHTMVGWFIDVLDPAFYEPWKEKNNLNRQLESLWQNGYISLVKLGSGSATARRIADGAYDYPIGRMAEFYKIWVDQGDGRKAMLAPLQEMNGDWVAYYPKDAPFEQKQKDFKDAYRHIVQIFESKGVTRSDAWWVFAPNGLSTPDKPENGFEYYYPGDEWVDIVGFASYNYGYCPATYKPGEYDYGKWENYDTIYEPYIRRIQAMAPSKPIIITETGTSAISTRYERNHGIYNYQKKAEWFVVNYGYLAKHPAVLGVFYFNLDEFDGKTCDLSLNNLPPDFQGYKQAIANNPQFRHLTTDELDNYIP